MKKSLLLRVISALLTVTVIFSLAPSVFSASPASANFKVLDISFWHEEVNWQKIATQVRAVIPRIGIRYSASRTISEDKMFYSHFSKAAAAGLSVGAYFYSTALNESQAKEEARWVIAKLKAYKFKPDMPIYIDMEDSRVERNLNKASRTAIANAFCDELTAQGYYPGIYANKWWLTDLLNTAQIRGTVWVAEYHEKCSFKGSYDMWQYTEKARLTGTPDPVDLNICYKDFPSFIKSNGYNGYEGTGEKQEPEKVPDYADTGTYKVSVDTLNARTAPDLNAGISTTLKKNDEFYVSSTVNGWGQTLIGSDYLWVNLNPSYSSKTSDFISTAEGIGHYTITADSLNVRKGPSVNYASLDYIYKNFDVFINQISSGWGRFNLGAGISGWINLSYAKFEGVISFSTQKGKAPAPIKALTGSKVTVPSVSGLGSGDKFLHWSLKNDGPAAYKPGDKLQMGKANIVLFAVFEGEDFSAWKSGITADKDKKTAVFSLMMSTASEFKNKFAPAASAVKPAKGTFVGTGSSVTFTKDQKSTVYTVSLRGDLNGDGICDALDLAAIRALGADSKAAAALSPAMLAAADMNSNGKFDSEDTELLRKTALGLN